MSVEIKRANRQDVESISFLGRVTFSETFGHLFRDPQDLTDYLKRTFSEEKIESSFENSNNAFWLALEDGVPVGYGKLKCKEDLESIGLKDVSQLQKIYVLKDHLSKRIGLKIQEAMLAEAKKIGSKVIWLSVLKENERAIGFYLKNGFAIQGEHDFQIGKELFHFHIMTKNL